MADIFLSYAREDVDRASSLAVALTAEGWSVFWDRHIPPGRTFEDYLEQRVRECRVQIVLWSPHSVASQWVKIEAAFGRDRNVLIPVLIAEAAIPFGYGHLHAADLTAWAPESKSIAFQELVSAIESLSPRTSPRKKRPTHHETAGRVTTEEPNPVSTRDQVRGLHSDNSPGFSVSAMPNLARLAVAIVLIAGTASIGVFWALRQSRQSGIGNTPQHTGPSANTTAQETVAGTLSPNQLKLFDEL